MMVYREGDGGPYHAVVLHMPEANLQDSKPIVRTYELITEILS